MLNKHRKPDKSGNLFSNLFSRLKEYFILNNGLGVIKDYNENGYGIRIDQDDTSGAFGYSSLRLQPVTEDTDYPGFMLILDNPGTTETDRVVGIQFRDGATTELYRVAANADNTNAYHTLFGGGDLYIRDADAHTIAMFKQDETMRFGDGVTNYAEIKDDGEINLHGTARVYKNLFIRPAALGVGGANPATATVNASGFGILEFADAADDYAQVNINVPTDMDVSADSEIRITWSVPNTSANMTWGYGYSIAGENEDTEAAPTTGSTPVTSSGTADGKTSDTLFTIAGGTLAQGDLVQIYFYRDVSADTYSNPVDVHGMALKYVANKLGAAT